MTFCITSPALPGVKFFSRQAALDHCSDALEIERIRQTFEADRDALAFTIDMQAFGFEDDEIEAAIANPASRPAVGYA